MSSSNCCFLTSIQISQEAGKVVWYSHLFKNFTQFVVIHTVKGFGIVNKEDTDVFLELCCFFDDPADVGNLISGSSAFYKTSLNIWKFMVHVLLKPGLEMVWQLPNITSRTLTFLSLSVTFTHDKHPLLLKISILSAIVNLQKHWKRLRKIFFSSLFVPILSLLTRLELFQASALFAALPFHYSNHHFHLDDSLVSISTSIVFLYC